MDTIENTEQQPNGLAKLPEDKSAISPSEADDLLSQLDLDEESEQEEPQEDSQLAPDEESEDPESAEDEGDVDDDEQLESEDSEQLRKFANPEHVVRVEGGEIMSIRELMEGNLRQSDYTRKTAEVRRLEEELTQRNQSVAQSEQEISQQREFLVNALSTLLPPAPDAALAGTDPVQYNVAKAAYDQAMGQLQAIQQQQQDAVQRQNQEQEQNYRRVVDRERTSLFNAIPELAQTEKFTAFMDNAAKAASHYGFSREEVMGTVDHRMYLLMQDAMKYREIVAGRGKAKKKADGKPRPVAKGGNRNAPKNPRRSTFDKAKARLRQTGDRQTAEALLEQFD